jgi:hypothetical protein
MINKTEGLGRTFLGRPPRQCGTTPDQIEAFDILTPASAPDGHGTADEREPARMKTTT